MTFRLLEARTSFSAVTGVQDFHTAEDRAASASAHEPQGPRML